MIITPLTAILFMLREDVLIQMDPAGTISAINAFGRKAKQLPMSSNDTELVTAARDVIRDLMIEQGKL